ncbi:deoxyribose-phosphate aldolase [Pseudomonas sp. NPDC078416]|uniref:deoxyribose-phosphate aldolase n=1 Tax=Pseudomonas sp. NPDC078416 TaxID=3390637 RepID=UPI003CFC6B5B
MNEINEAIDVHEADASLAELAVGLMELASLNADDTPEKIIALCHRALTPVGYVAAVCVMPRFVGLARRTLDSLHAREIKVVAAVNFPSGSPSVSSAESETQAAILAGADEIDLVYPFHALLGGDRQIGADIISACKARCGRSALTVTLETGVLRDPQVIHGASCMAIQEGANFLKTSTGKHILNTTPQASRILIAAIAESGAHVGINVSGNVRTLDEARVHMDLVKARFGPRWLEQGRLRLGATSLLDDLLGHLGVGA